MVSGYNYFLGASGVDFSGGTKDKRLKNNGVYGRVAYTLHRTVS
jgi:hypothetical protein